MATLLTTILLPTPIYSPEKPLSAAFTASISSVLPSVMFFFNLINLLSFLPYSVMLYLQLLK